MGLCNSTNKKSDTKLNINNDSVNKGANTKFNNNNNSQNNETNTKLYNNNNLSYLEVWDAFIKINQQKQMQEMYILQQYNLFYNFCSLNGLNPMDYNSFVKFNYCVNGIIIPPSPQTPFNNQPNTNQIIIYISVVLIMVIIAIIMIMDIIIILIVILTLVILLTANQLKILL